MRHTFLVVTVKKWLKSVYIYRSYRKIKTGVPLFWTTQGSSEHDQSSAFFKHPVCALRGIATVSRLSFVCPSACNVDVFRGHTSWVSLGYSFLEPQQRQSSPRGTPPKLRSNRGGVALLNRKPAISLKRGKMGPRLLLMTNRKSHMCFRLVPKSITFDDLEWPLPTPLHRTCVFRRPPQTSSKGTMDLEGMRATAVIAVHCTHAELTSGHALASRYSRCVHSHLGLCELTS